MGRVTFAFAGISIATQLVACSNAPTSILTRQGTGVPVATSSPAPARTATPSPVPSASAPAATPGPITLTPASLAAANVVPAPGSASEPTVCATGSPANYTCFAGDPHEIDPSEAGYTGTFTPQTSNASIAVTVPCGTAGTAPCVSANGFLVYPQGIGATTIGVRDTQGNSSTLPVSVAQTNLNIMLQNLPSAQMVCVGYVTAAGVAGSFVSYTPIVNASSNPTIVLANVPAPVNVSYATFRVVVNPAGGGMSGCANGVAQATLSHFTLAPGTTNTENIPVSPSTQ
jgi:hypothetical protein